MFAITNPAVTQGSTTTIVAGQPNGAAQDGSVRRIEVELVDNAGTPLSMR